MIALQKQYMDAVAHAQSIYASSNIDVDLLYTFAVSYSYHNPSPSICAFESGYKPEYGLEGMRFLSAQELHDMELVYTNSKVGNHKEVYPINPLTKRKLGTYCTCLLPESFDKYADVIYDMHSVMGDCYLTRNEFKEYFIKGYDYHAAKPLKGKIRFVNEPISHKRNRGTLVKETSTKYHILNGTGIHIINKK